MSVKSRVKHKDKSEADSLGNLYANHEFEDGVAIGPVEIRKPMITFKFKAAPKIDEKPATNSHPCKICKDTKHKHYTCSECDLCVFTKLEIIAHLRKHKTPLTCSVCKKTFQYQHKLKNHMIRHSKEKKFKCNICQKAYKHAYSLAVHKCSAPKEKPFKCEHCPKSFASKGQLQAHSRLHTGEKPYPCNICSRAFTQQTSLNNHVLKHEGVKPHRCVLCKKRFRQVSNLKKHMEVKHPAEVGKSKKAQKSKKRVSLVWYSCKKCHVVLSGSDKINKHRETCK